MHVIQHLKTLNDAYPSHKASREQVTLYASHLSKWESATVARGIELHLKTLGQWYPSLPELLQAVVAADIESQGGDPDHVHFEAFLRHILRLVRDSATAPDNWRDDRFLAEVVQEHGGWASIRMADNLKFSLKTAHETVLRRWVR